MSKIMIVQVGIHDEESRQKAMKAVSGLSGIVSLSADIPSRKLTVVGDADPIAVVNKLKKKKCSPSLESLGPVKDKKKEEEEKKKKEEEEKKKKKEEEEKKKKEEEEREAWGYYHHNRPIIFDVMDDHPSNCVFW